MKQLLKYGSRWILLMILAVPFQAHAELLGDYVGVTACVKCHGDIVAGWKTTPHGNAFEDLKQQGEEKQSIPGCFKCHVVGFEEDGGYVDMTLTPELKDVQCENCHGPGRKHVESDGDPSLITGRPSEASCRVCHTPGQDKNFDFAKKIRFVHGAKTENTKALPPVESQDSSALHISETLVAFGYMVEGVEVQKTVTLTNTGEKKIRITNVTTSCACTTTRLDKHELDPNESTSLEITYHTYKFPGKFLKYVTVFTDGSGKSEYVVNINGFVKAIPMGVLEVKPRKIVLNGKLKTNTPVLFNLAIKNTGDADMTVTKIVSKKKETIFFDGAQKGNLVIGPGKTATVKATAISGEKGRMIDYIMIHSDARNVTEKGYKVVLIGTFE